MLFAVGGTDCAITEPRLKTECQSRTAETSGRHYRTERRMLESTLAIGLANRLNTEVDYSIRRYRARFCIDCVPSRIFDHSRRAAVTYQIEPVLSFQVSPCLDLTASASLAFANTEAR
jgi:hypothetical protein